MVYRNAWLFVETLLVQSKLLVYAIKDSAMVYQYHSAWIRSCVHQKFHIDQVTCGFRSLDFSKHLPAPATECFWHAIERLNIESQQFNSKMVKVGIMQWPFTPTSWDMWILCSESVFASSSTLVLSSACNGCFARKLAVKPGWSQSVLMRWALLGFFL